MVTVYSESGKEILLSVIFEMPKGEDNGIV